MTVTRVKCPVCGEDMKVRVVYPKGWECPNPKCNKWISNYDVQMAGWTGLEEITNEVLSSEAVQKWEIWYLAKSRKK